MTPLTLQRENRAYGGRGGVSAETHPPGLAPAFMDIETGRVLASCFEDGRPAPIHLLQGLPDDLVVQRSATGRVVAVKDSVVAGFVWHGGFLTREQAACVLAQAWARVASTTYAADASTPPERIEELKPQILRVGMPL